MKRLILIVFLLAGALFFLGTSDAYADCNATRFIIEDEVSGQELGVMYTDTTTMRKENVEICLEGVFLGTEYQYLYKCVEGRRFKFIKKFKTHQDGCKWGNIH